MEKLVTKNHAVVTLLNWPGEKMEQIPVLNTAKWHYELKTHTTAATISIVRQSPSSSLLVYFLCFKCTFIFVMILFKSAYRILFPLLHWEKVSDILRRHRR